MDDSSDGRLSALAAVGDAPLLDGPALADGLVQTLLTPIAWPSRRWRRSGGRSPTPTAGSPTRRQARKGQAPCIAEHERRAVTIANPHVYTLEDGAGHKRVDADQLRFKAAADPYGLLNPGKMRSYRPVA